jgi:hypothetical protein
MGTGSPEEDAAKQILGCAVQFEQEWLSLLYIAASKSHSPVTPFKV